MFASTIHCCLAELGCTVTHLALAWVASNPNTSTVILGATRPEQLLDNLKALEVVPKLTPAVLEKIEEILKNKPSPVVSLVSVLPENYLKLSPARPKMVVTPWMASGLVFCKVVNIHWRLVEMQYISKMYQLAFSASNVANLCEGII